MRRYTKNPWYKSAVPKGGKRSTFEDTLARDMQARGLDFEYEPPDSQLGYMLTYKPDFRLPNGILVEAKGLFDSEDRTKMLHVKRANPTADIRMVFMRNNKINPKSKTRYSDWCQKHGFPYHIGDSIPEAWWKE